MPAGNKAIRLTLAMVASLGAGAGTAVVASGAGEDSHLITLEAGPEERLLIRAAGGRDKLSIGGTAPGAVMLSAPGLTNQFTNQRTDCEVLGVVSTNAVCDSPNLETIDVGMRKGRDKVFFDDFVANAVKIIVRGGAGPDDLRGSDRRDDLQGGTGSDELRGLRGNDRLDGGSQRDTCRGGEGRDRILNCE